MCKVLKISKSSYYHWLHAKPNNLWLENPELSSLIKSIFKSSYQSYGRLGYNQN